MPAIAMGRCKACKVSWTWKQSTRITLRGDDERRITCPLCGGYLWQTTSWAKADWRSMDGAGHPAGLLVPVQPTVRPEYTHVVIMKRRGELDL